MIKISKRDLNYYMGLHYTVSLREDDEGDVVATVQELPGCMAHGKDAGEAWRNIRRVQRAWIEECLESGNPIPVPAEDEVLPSGKWVQRVPRTIHKRLVERARDEGVSLNQLVSTMVAAALASGPRRSVSGNSRSHAEPRLRHG